MAITIEEIMQKPYRVVKVRQSSQVGCYGWAYTAPKMFATQEEAIAEVMRPMDRGVFKATADCAIVKDGKIVAWQHIKSRSRKK